jgi:hypothetical protein
MNNDKTKSRTDTSNEPLEKGNAPQSGGQKENGLGQEPKKGRDVKDLLKNAKRRGITQKGQQGVIEFDYPRKKE